VDVDPGAARHGDRLGVHLDAVVEDHQVGDLLLAHEAVDPQGPGLLGVAVGGVRLQQAPVGEVAAVEHHLGDFEPARVQAGGDVREEGAERSPQEEEVPLARLGPGALRGPRTAPARPDVELFVIGDAVRHGRHAQLPSSPHTHEGAVRLQLNAANGRRFGSCLTSLAERSPQVLPEQSICTAPS
jgi:hypothetical protein